MTDSIGIHIIDEIAKGMDPYHSCKIKIVHSDNDVRYIDCEFYSTKYKTVRFEYANGNTGIIDQNRQPIEYNTYNTINKVVEAKMDDARAKAKNR